jgi:hypothetical protein
MHKNKVFLTMGLMEKNKLNKWINTRFIGLLCVAFFLQHFSYATLQNNFTLNNIRSEAKVNNYVEKAASEIPNLDINVFEEVESEDEDDIHNEQNVSNDLISFNQIFNTECYTDVVNTLYLKLASTNQHKVELPFFILYHSWKSELV